MVNALLVAHACPDDDRKCEGKVLTASDEAAEDREWTQVGSWGATVCGPGEEPSKETSYTKGSILDGFDQCPWMGEAYGALMILLAAAVARVDIWLLIDNLAVQRKVEEVMSGTWSIPRFGFGIIERIAKSCQGRKHGCSWVPSHGKRQQDCAPNKRGQQTKTWRQLNALADEEATAHRKLHAAQWTATYKTRCEDEWATASVAAEE